MFFAVSVNVEDARSFQISRYFLSRILNNNNNINKPIKNLIQNLQKNPPEV